VAALAWVKVATSEARRRSVRHANAVIDLFCIDSERPGRLTRRVIVGVAEKWKCSCDVEQDRIMPITSSPAGVARLPHKLVAKKE
jgi:hypothetical protein